jgi:hypothetical protein
MGAILPSTLDIKLLIKKLISIKLSKKNMINYKLTFNIYPYYR